MKKFILLSLFVTATAVAMTPPGGPNPHDDDLEEQPQKEQKVVDKNDNKDQPALQSHLPALRGSRRRQSLLLTMTGTTPLVPSPVEGSESVGGGVGGKSKINLFEITKPGNELELQKALEEKKIDPNIKGSCYAGNYITNTSFPLSAAIYHDNARATELLLAHGAKTVSTKDSGYTALHSVASQGSPECLLFLLMNGAQINIQTKLVDICWNEGNGEHTPLHYAVHEFCSNAKQKRDCIKLLVLNGADPLLKGKGKGVHRSFNGTVMDVARRQRCGNVPQIITDAQKERVELCKLSSKILSVEGPTALSQLPKELIAVIVAYADNHVIFTLKTMKELES